MFKRNVHKSMSVDQAKNTIDSSTFRWFVLREEVLEDFVAASVSNSASSYIDGKPHEKTQLPECCFPRDGSAPEG